MRRGVTVVGVPAGTPPVAWRTAMSREGRGQEGSRPVGRGGFVRWERQKCRVVQRRRVSALAFPRTSEFELLLEAADGGSGPGWVAENEVEPDDEGGTAEGTR